MAAATSGPLPTRSEIEKWEYGHLLDAAARLQEAAVESEHLFDQHLKNVMDAPWEGQARNSAYERATADHGVAARQNAVRRQAANIAENGAADLRAAQREALAAIEHIENDGFRVGENLSVTDTRRVDLDTLGTRRQAATEHAEDIRWCAEKLLATDTLVGRRLAENAAEMESIRFEGEEDAAIQAVDYKQVPQLKTPLDEILERYQVGEDPGGTHEIDFPAWVDKLAGSEVATQELTATEIRMLLTNPAKIKDVMDIREQASAEAVERFPPPDGVREIDNQTDAFRHAYANALMTQKFGEEWTGKFTTAHEGRDSNYASSEAMDLYNNEIGRQIAVEHPNASPEELADLVQQAVNDGQTVVIRPDGQGLEWSNSIPSAQTGDSSRSAPVEGTPLPPYPSLGG